MNFLFYDTETTGVNVAFDQIVQFAAIVTDENFVELGRLNIRCRLLPWVVPSPVALLVTNTSPRNLTDPDLPSHFEMMAKIKAWLRRWQPSVFVGYNSMKFDEILLHRAFWQTLNPPYVTVTNGNSRLDLLPVIRALSVLRPEALDIPLNDRGTKTFKLDRLAPANGFVSHNAHDALGDVEATIFLARRVAERAPDFWKTLSRRTLKSAVSSVLTPENLIYILGNSPSTPQMLWAQRVDRHSNTSDAIVADLAFDWKRLESNHEDENATPESSYSQHLRTVSFNKSPVFFTLDEAEELFSESPTQEIIFQSALLKKADWIEGLSEAVDKRADRSTERTPELEETIYDGFADKLDARLMDRFQRSDWPERSEIANEFSDYRFRRLAVRIIYASVPGLLTEQEKLRMDVAIQERFHTPPETLAPWRSIASAQAELEAAKKQWGEEEGYSDIERWISNLHH